MDDTISSLVGDVPVSEQISSALEHIAKKDHIHNYATIDEVEELKKKIEALMDLVGDISVAEQIAAALKNIK